MVQGSSSNMFAATSQASIIRPTGTGRNWKIRKVWSNHASVTKEEGISEEEAQVFRKDFKESLVTGRAHVYAHRFRQHPARSVMELEILEELSPKYVPILDPDSIGVLAWRFVGASLLFLDVVMVPLQAFIEDEEPTALQLLDLFSSLYWTVNIAINFFVGYYSNNVLVKTWGKIARAYIRGWFRLDLPLVLAMWALYLLPFLSARYLRLLRVFRLPSLVRLARLARLVRFKTDIVPRIRSFRFLVFMRVFTWMVLTGVSIHVMACVWYVIGRLPGGWVEASGLEDAPMVVKYYTCILFVFARTDGQAAYHPSTPEEFLYAGAVSSLTMIILVLVVGSVTVTMTLLHNIAHDESQKAVFKFIQRHHLSEKLTMSIKDNVEKGLSEQESRHQDKQVFDLLPRHLSHVVTMALHETALTSGHVTFKHLHAHFEGFFLDLCCKAVTLDYHREDDIIFKRKERCDDVRCTVSDGYRYYSGEDDKMSETATETFIAGMMQNTSSGAASTPGFRSLSSLDRKEKSSTVPKGTWISEAAFWTKWQHNGDFWASGPASLLCLPVSRFEEVVLSHGDVWYVVCLYARMFVRHLKDASDQDEEPTDLLGNIPPELWEKELNETDLDVINNQEEHVPLPWQDELPPHVSPQVATAGVQMARRIAEDGLDERRGHHGFTVVIGCSESLKACGTVGFNPFSGNDVRIVNASGEWDEAAFEVMQRNAFHGDGAVVIDGITGQVVASSWFVDDISLGGDSGGARTKSAKAVAQQAGGCYVIKASEDSTGEVILHLGERRLKFRSTVQASEGWGRKKTMPPPVELVRGGKII